MRKGQGNCVLPQSFLRVSGKARGPLAHRLDGTAWKKYVQVEWGRGRVGRQRGVRAGRGAAHSQTRKPPLSSVPRRLTKQAVFSARLVENGGNELQRYLGKTRQEAQRDPQTANSWSGRVCYRSWNRMTVGADGGEGPMASGRSLPRVVAPCH